MNGFQSIYTMIFLVLLTGKGMTGRAQELEEGRHSLLLMIGHEHSFNGRDDEGKKKVLILPFYGLDYNYRISEKFSIGLHTDFVVESFKVEKNLKSDTSEVVERTRPVAPAVMAFYKAGKHWSFGLGMGGEFAREENYWLNRAGVEYASEIRNGWEVSGGIQYDFRWKAYDTYTIGLGIGKSFGKKKK